MTARTRKFAGKEFKQIPFQKIGIFWRDFQEETDR